MKETEKQQTVRQEENQDIFVKEQKLCKKGRSNTKLVLLDESW